MKIESRIDYDKEDIENIIRDMEKKYGTLNSLQQKVAMRKCTSPEMMDDYMIWKNLTKKGARMEEVHIWRGAEVMNSLTARRMELLDYIGKNEGKSIMSIAAALRRNYKNIYDDLLALEKIGLVGFRKAGRKKIPFLLASKIIINISD